MFGISLTLNNELIFDKEFNNREERRTVNRVIGSLDKKIYKTLVFTMAVFGFTSNRAYAGVDEAVEKLDRLGALLLTIIQKVGFWVCVLGCLLEIAVSVFKKGGGQKEIIGIVFKWLLIFGCFYIVPSLFKLIITFFG